LDKQELLQKQVDAALSREATHRAEARAREDARDLENRAREASLAKSNADQQNFLLGFATANTNNQKDMMLGFMSAMTGRNMTPQPPPSAAGVTHQRQQQPALKSDIDGQLLLGNEPKEE
jgi:hypothetical protein